MRAGDYAGALPLLEQAVAGLSGSGETAEAYASYNLAFTRLALGALRRRRSSCSTARSRCRATARRSSGCASEAERSCGGEGGEG